MHRWRNLLRILLALKKKQTIPPGHELFFMREPIAGKLSLAPYGTTWWPRHRGAGSDRDYDAYAGDMDGGNGTRASGTAGGDAGTLRTAMETAAELHWKTLHGETADVIYRAERLICPCNGSKQSNCMELMEVEPDLWECPHCGFERSTIGLVKR